jgi:SAM-dependent methyltransferase
MGEDPFGEAFLDYYEGKGPVMTIERDDGYEDQDNMSEYFAEYKDFPECEKRALEHVRGRVLDIGVGAGRAALHLQSKGFEVVGIDLSDKAIEVARRRGVKQTVKMSACDIHFEEGSFGTAIAFGNNFGLCGSPEGVMAMLLRLRKVLTNDGVILAESINPLATDNEAHLKYHAANRAKGRMAGQVRLRDRYKGLVSIWSDLLMVTPAEMRGMAERVGWMIEVIYENRGPPSFYVAVLKKL